MIKNFTLISAADIQDLFNKIKEKGSGYFLRKLKLSSRERVINTWSEKSLPPVNWWVIPAVRERWNRLITGNPKLDYIDYLGEKYFDGRDKLTALSVGCGTGSQELKLSRLKCFKQIDAFDISKNNISQAIEKALQEDRENLNFFVSDFYKFPFEKKQYDLILFHSSLHHFKNVEQALKKVKKSLKPGGLLVIHEYTGPDRLQFTDRQIEEVNRILKTLPAKYRKLWNSDKVKEKHHRPGWLRMILSDPSEAVQSSRINGLLEKHFKIVELKPYGGTILHLLFKDIAHNFISDTPETRTVLEDLFRMEDEFMEKTGSSDFTFGVFKGNKDAF